MNRVTRCHLDFIDESLDHHRVTRNSRVDVRVPLQEEDNVRVRRWR